MSDPTAATHDPEGTMCYGFSADGVWLDTRFGWVIPGDAVADVCEADVNHVLCDKKQELT
jgi:hypothetical protein